MAHFIKITYFFVFLNFSLPSCHCPCAALLLLPAVLHCFLLCFSYDPVCISFSFLLSVALVFSIAISLLLLKLPEIGLFSLVFKGKTKEYLNKNMCSPHDFLIYGFWRSVIVYIFWRSLFPYFFLFFFGAIVFSSLDFR